MNVHRALGADPRLLLGVALAVTMVAQSALANRRADLEERLDRGEVVLETRAVKGSPVPKVTAIAVVGAPPADVWAIISSCERLQEVLEDGSVAELLSQQGQRSRCRVRVAMPFPLSDLVSITDVEQRVTPGRRWTSSWTHAGGDFEVNEGSWVLAPHEGGTLVVYTVRARPSLPVPEKLLVQTQRSRMAEILERLREVLAPARRAQAKRGG